MFLSLLLVTFAISAGVSLAVAWAFRGSIRRILDRLVSADLGRAWVRYITFAIFVVGVSGGVRIYALEAYVTGRNVRAPDGGGTTPITLDADRWVLEVYRTVIQTLQSIAWMLLVFFLVALIAYVIVRGFELRAQRDS